MCRGRAIMARGAPTDPEIKAKILKAIHDEVTTHQMNLQPKYFNFMKDGTKRIAVAVIFPLM